MPFFSPQPQAPGEGPPPPPLSGPVFANPNEISSANKQLRAVVQLSADKYLIPNIGAGNLRQFRGWDATKPAPTPTPTPAAPLGVSPGPTLRARLGDQVQVSFLNRIDDDKFDYTFVTDSPPGVSDFGCDKAGKRDPATGKVMPYPADDKFPNCFHGSSTANIHFHGAHASPDGVGDNVLVQVMPQVDQPDWTATFTKLFESGKIPEKWTDMPADYQTKQMELIKVKDPELYKANQKRIDAGMWPQYLMGAFPNFFGIPDYDKVDGDFNSGGNGYKAGQAPGTHWYHAHKHGSTSLHILNGLAGALIIESSREGGYDHVIRSFYGWGETYRNHEKILIFQQYDSIQNLERGKGAGPRPVLVNGQMTPTINMAPGEVQLWRMVNATEGNTAGIIQKTVFQTPGFTFKQTALDGVQFSPANYKNQPFLTAVGPNGMVPGGLELAAGNRADLLVQAPATVSTIPIPFKSGGAVLFYVNVTGAAVPPPAAGVFPVTWAEMPAFLNDLPQPGPNDAINQNSPVKFQWEDGRFGPAPKPPAFPFAPHFMINGKQFGQTGEVVDQCMPQDGLQEWILENYTNMAHPFHIHINPFQVIRIETPTGRDTYSVYAPTNNFVWQDVIAVPAAKISTTEIKDPVSKQVLTTQITNVTPGRIRIRQTYLDFTGTYVLHCHILAHEDRGMMQLVRVVPSANYPQKCQDSVPAHH